MNEKPTMAVDLARPDGDRTVFGTFSFFKNTEGATVIDIEATVVREEPKRLE